MTDTFQSLLLISAVAAYGVSDKPRHAYERCTYGVQMMSRIFSKHLLSIFIVGICAIFATRTAAQMPSLATRIFERYQPLFQRDDIRELLPDVLIALKQPDIQALLRPSMIKLISENPDLLRIIVPEIDNRFIELLKEDPEVNTLINDPDLHVLLQNPAGIDELAVLLDIGTVASVGIVPASIESPDVGDEFSIAVVATNAQNVRGYQLSVQFDPEVLRYVSWQQGTYLSGDVFAASATVEADQVSFVAIAPVKAERTQGVLLTLRFEVVAEKASILSLSNVMLVNSDGIGLPVKTEDSEIIEPMSVEIADSETVEPTPSETEDTEVVESVPVETEDTETVESMPEETEDSETVESMPEKTEDGGTVEPTPEGTEDRVEPMPVDTEDGGTVEPTPEGTEDTETVERSTPAWDVNEDRFVNILDLVLVSANFGMEGPVPTDVNGDNTVNILDLTLVVNHLGEYYEEP
ncbi:hypothetical protein C6500_10305 [Candidatus Poribacteria bacterium]|nr:MAG: hypothetical protein C6500_10305 [Candidatus Poribacteria bacterium]